LELLVGLQEWGLNLTNRAQDVPAHHRSLRAAIGWSYDRLTPAEQALVRRLAVFAGGCSVDAVGTVCGPLERGTAFNELAGLVRKNLLRREGSADGGPQFQMLEVVREYAQAWLADAGEQDIYRQQHAAFFVGLAERADWEANHGSQRRALLDRLQHEADNPRAALRWAVEHVDAEMINPFGSHQQNPRACRATTRANLRSCSL
jgi:predicted ATPase